MMNISDDEEGEEEDRGGGAGVEEASSSRLGLEAKEPFFATLIRGGRGRDRGCRSRLSLRKGQAKSLKKCFSLPCQLSQCSAGSRSTCSARIMAEHAAAETVVPTKRRGYFYESVGGVYYTLGATLESLSGNH